MVPAKLISARVKHRQGHVPDYVPGKMANAGQQPDAGGQQAGRAMLPSRMSRAPAIRLFDVSRKTANTRSDKTIAVTDHSIEYGVSVDRGVAPQDWIEELADREPAGLEREQPDHHEGKPGGEDRVQ